MCEKKIQALAELTAQILYFTLKTMAAQIFQEYESEYELERQQRIKENNEIMRKIFGDAQTEHFPALKRTTRARSSSPYVARKKDNLTPLRRNPKRIARSYHSEEVDNAKEASDQDIASENRLIVHWVGPLTKKRRISGKSTGDADLGEEGGYHRSRSHSRIIQHVVRPVSDFCEEDLLSVAETVAEKRYDSINGTSCHQCRQKTDDLKTVCRNENCIGIRGQFCGPCLRNRYGESVKEAIMDPDWVCPPCRKICNCSLCMKKRGRSCTGHLIGIARQNGYTDVKSFLGD